MAFSTVDLPAPLGPCKYTSCDSSYFLYLTFRIPSIVTDLMYTVLSLLTCVLLQAHKPLGLYVSGCCFALSYNFDCVRSFVIGYCSNVPKLSIALASIRFTHFNGRSVLCYVLFTHVLFAYALHLVLQACAVMPLLQNLYTVASLTSTHLSTFIQDTTAEHRKFKLSIAFFVL